MTKPEIADFFKQQHFESADWENVSDVLSDIIPIEYTGVSIDGGGILGIGPARFLAKLEYKDEAFLAGTSTGSILAALRGKGLEWQEILEIFQQEGKQIFKKPGFWWRANIQMPKYNEANLEATLKKYLGDMKMKDLKKPVYITASDFLSGKPKVFYPHDEDLVRYAVRCSTAAPTYFAPVDRRYADGGLWANNPALVGIAGFCRKTEINPLRCRILSLGTGGDKWDAVGIKKSMNLLQWANPVIQYSLNGTEESPSFIARALLNTVKDGLENNRRFLRISPTLTKTYKLDSIDVMEEYSGIWADWEAENHAVVWKWLKNTRPE
jgi:hypothetical protein